MDKQKVIEDLNLFKERLTGEVLQAFNSRGREFGQERFNAWRRKLSQFLDDNLPGETSVLNEKLTHYAISIRRDESDAQRFWRQDGEAMLAYIDSLMIDVENDEYDFREAEEKTKVVLSQNEKQKNKVFIVHGHDGNAKERTARFIEKLGFEAIILHEQASRSMTIIEKIESYANDVGFGIVLYTPDDMGNIKEEAEKGELKYRARQNVVFEHGFLIGKLGRENVTPLVEGAIELPNDISGIVYINDKDWKLDIAKEMKAAGYEIDFNKLM
ncbi:nucleotide-binding protein [Billgrantia antri]|uniref:Nucleotide-binding protein n=1 Tax=Halomonas sulfidivorans TaxID=2733488 RepID=A0ABX7WFU8_9GAMM|nr:nucleotide-binding protein [Halomonas sulfidivorans]QTP59200.1 nucleotide-binding protein [Halomonas sulfidivorans]